MTAEDLAELRPLVAELRAMQRHCKPFGSDYAAVAISLAALDHMAEELLGEPAFFGAQKDTVGPVRR